MGIYVITANDTLTVTGMFNGKMTTQNFTTLADKSVVHMDFPNELWNIAIGKNKNAIFSFIQKGNLSEMDLRPLLGNADHAFLLAQITQAQNNPPGVILLTGTFSKILGDGAGNPIRVNYTLSGGVVSKLPPLTENVEGETDQGVGMFKLKWAF